MTLAAEIIQDLEDQNIHLKIEGDKIRLASDRKPDDKILTKIRANKKALLEFLANDNSPDERAAIHEYDGKLPRQWAVAFSKLQFMDKPDQYTAAEWEQVINDAGLFADKWAARARDLGWTILDVFAVHKSESRKRLDGEGVILSICGHKVVAVTAEHVMIETKTGARQRICKPTATKGSIRSLVQL